MAYSKDILRKKIEDARFSLWMYEIYSRKMPTDKAVLHLCEKYRDLISALLMEYNEKFGENYELNNEKNLKV